MDDRCYSRRCFMLPRRRHRRSCGALLQVGDQRSSFRRQPRDCGRQSCRRGLDGLEYGSEGGINGHSSCPDGLELCTDRCSVNESLRSWRASSGGAPRDQTETPHGAMDARMRLLASCPQSSRPFKTLVLVSFLCRLPSVCRIGQCLRSFCSILTTSHTPY